MGNSGSLEYYDSQKETKGDENMSAKIQTTSPVTSMDNEWVTTGEAAKILRVAITTVKRWIKTGRLTGRQLGGEGGWIQVSVESIVSLLNVNDPEVIKRQAIEKALEETSNLGDDELTPELLDDLSMSKQGKLPWQV
jgi:excisionase family DNA binding protein